MFDTVGYLKNVNSLNIKIGMCGIFSEEIKNQRLIYKHMSL